jgi:hypothetical protein
MGTLENIVVIVLVAGSAFLSGWWLTPTRARLWLLDRLVDRSATRGPLVALRRTLLAKAALGCGACKAKPSAGAQRSTQKAAGLRR